MTRATEMLSVTEEPSSARAPAAGSVDSTMPSTSSDLVSTTAVENPRCSSCAAASTCVMPTTLGTARPPQSSIAHVPPATAAPRMTTSATMSAIILPERRRGAREADGSSEGVRDAPAGTGSAVSSSAAALSAAPASSGALGAVSASGKTSGTTESSVLAGAGSAGAAGTAAGSAGVPAEPSADSAADAAPAAGRPVSSSAIGAITSLSGRAPCFCSSFSRFAWARSALRWARRARRASLGSASARNDRAAATISSSMRGSCMVSPVRPEYEGGT